MREKHGKQRRGWLKVHVAVDVESKKLLSLEVTEEDTPNCDTNPTRAAISASPFGRRLLLDQR